MFFSGNTVFWQLSGFVSSLLIAGYLIIMDQKCLIIRRDEQGFGLRVSGDNPVTVEYVKPRK